MKWLGILSLFSICQFANAQIWSETNLASLPEPVSNNAVCEGFSSEGMFAYSFSGIDSTLSSSGIHLKSWRFNTQTLQMEVLPDLPDSLGKIAAAASRVGNVIYIIGGYHVLPNGVEVSSEKVHRFDITQNQFLTDGSPIPTPIDDHVQAVYKDSLIFVVTGWSNNGNVTDVQVYNTYTDTWQVGTPTPNSNNYRCFGASGEIVGDTIYYFGGAAGFNFSAQTELRKGYINPADPTEITWSELEPSPVNTTYRAAACVSDGAVHWIGGSTVTYNYNAIAYNGSGLVPPANAAVFYHPNGNWGSEQGAALPMDLRGIANLTDRRKIIIGGIGPDGEVRSEILELNYEGSLSASTNVVSNNPFLYPNPCYGTLYSGSAGHLTIRSLTGQLVFSKLIAEQEAIGLDELAPSVYRASLRSKGLTLEQKLIIVK